MTNSVISIAIIIVVVAAIVMYNSSESFGMTNSVISIAIIIVVVAAIVMYNSSESFGMSTRHTRNMSYDLRGDPCVIRRNLVSPWGISSLSSTGTLFCN
jgi:hypothetical protein